MPRQVFVLAFIAALFVVPQPSAVAGSPGWITICRWSHTVMDDPIVVPGRPGGSHSHEMNANTTTNANSTYESMLDGATTCGTVEDKAGYWIPTVYEDGVRVPLVGKRPDGVAIRHTFYYRVSNISSSYLAAHPVEAFPANFRMIAGNSKATTTAENPKLGREIYWGCSDNSTGKLSTPPNCPSGAISLHVGFPNCWNGQVTRSNDTPNVVYPSGGVCPALFPRVLPRVIFRYEFPVGKTTGRITLASGSVYSIHGDFWNTWEQVALEDLVVRCLRAGADCGNNPTPRTSSGT